MSKTLKILLPIGLILLFTIISGISSYNGLVTQEESVKQANSKIETALQRRNDLIPNYVAVTKKYMKHEEEIFTKIVKMKEKVNYLQLFQDY